MKLTKEFNTYLADLAVMTFKLHNLHWNVTGLQFKAIHEFTEAIYETTFEYFDQIAEHQKFYNHIPDSKLSDYLANSHIKEIDAKEFGAKEVLEILKADLEHLREEATSLRDKADEEQWFSAVGLLEGHVDYYNKQIWFVNESLK